MSDKVMVLVSPTSDAGVSKGLADRALRAVAKEIDLGLLREALHRFVRNMGDVLTAAPNPEGFRLKHVEVGIELSAEGGVILVGTVTAAGKAAITLTFERT